MLQVEQSAREELQTTSKNKRTSCTIFFHERAYTTLEDNYPSKDGPITLRGVLEFTLSASCLEIDREIEREREREREREERARRADERSQERSTISREKPRFGGGTHCVRVAHRGLLLSKAISKAYHCARIYLRVHPRVAQNPCRESPAFYYGNIRRARVFSARSHLSSINTRSQQLVPLSKLPLVILLSFPDTECA